MGKKKEMVCNIIIGVTLGEFFENGIEKIDQQMYMNGDIIDVYRYVATLPSGAKKELYNETKELTIFNLQAIFGEILLLSKTKTLELLNVPDQLTIENLHEVIIGKNYGEIILDGQLQSFNTENLVETKAQLENIFSECLSYNKKLHTIVYARKK